jgi:hypothetical protein
LRHHRVACNPKRIDLRKSGASAFEQLRRQLIPRRFARDQANI